MGTNPTITVDLDAVKKEVGALTEDQVREQLLKIRTRAKVQQKKYQGGEGQKKYQMKAREKARLLKERAMELGLWDKVNEEAEANAEKLLEAEAENEPETATA